jgi:DNA-binding Xre family transcriptional regulator
MIRINLQHLLLLKNVHDARKFFVDKGINSTTAYRYVKMTNTRFTFKELEMLCLMFDCTPNDILEWIPNREHASQGYALEKLIRTQEEESLIHVIAKLPVEELMDVKRYILEKSKSSKEVK